MTDTPDLAAVLIAALSCHRSERSRAVVVAEVGEQAADDLARRALAAESERDAAAAAAIRAECAARIAALERRKPGRDLAAERQRHRDQLAEVRAELRQARAELRQARAATAAATADAAARDRSLAARTEREAAVADALAAGMAAMERERRLAAAGSG